MFEKRSKGRQIRSDHANRGFCMRPRHDGVEDVEIIYAGRDGGCRVYNGSKANYASD